MDEKELARSKDFVQSLGRGLSIMKIFSAENPRLTLSEVAELTGYTRATARRFLLTLESLGYVGSTERHFYLKSQVLTLGYAYLSSFSLVSIAQMHLEELSADLRESCSASVLEGRECNLCVPSNCQQNYDNQLSGRNPVAGLLHIYGKSFTCINEADRNRFLFRKCQIGEINF